MPATHTIQIRVRADIHKSWKRHASRYGRRHHGNPNIGLSAYIRRAVALQIARDNNHKSPFEEAEQNLLDDPNTHTHKEQTT